jgi:hydrogenase nickel incorporation protein HypA/HybF
MRFSCRDCGRTGPIEDHLGMVACSRCGGIDVDITGTDDVRLESITVDAAGSQES